jgi:transcriptional regulator of aromatic amino acid metabolism
MLHETIIRKNEELKKINENLEHLVIERTKDLEIQNQALELSRTILQELPFPVIGISSERIIVFQNNKSISLSDSGSNFLLGKEISEFFSDHVAEKIDDVFKTGTGALLNNIPMLNSEYDIEITPLSGSFRGKGLLAVLLPVKTR